MFEVLKFYIKCITDFMAMLFTIDVGFTSLGMLMCICFIFFPTVLAFIHIIKFVVIDELDDMHDYNSRNKIRYIGKHENVGRHSKRYSERVNRLWQMDGRPKHGRYRE